MCSSEYGCDGGDWISYDSLPPTISCYHSSLPEVLCKKRRPHSVKCTKSKKISLSVILMCLVISSFPYVLSNERVSKAIRTFEFRRNHGGEQVSSKRDVGVEFAGELSIFKFLKLVKILSTSTFMKKTFISNSSCD